jgi:ABC-type antimicrobial peptide transport system permease subunit
VTNVTKKDGASEDWSKTPLLLGPSLRDSEASIEATTRIEYEGVSLRYHETVLSEFAWFVDPDFTKIFDFPVLRGSGRALEKKSNVVLEESIAEKYFGSTDPIGQAISIKFGNGTKEEFMVGAVIKRPSNSSLYPSVLFSMEANPRRNAVGDWHYLADATFILMKPFHTTAELRETMTRYKALQNVASPEWAIEEFRFHAMRGLAAQQDTIVGAISVGSHPAGLISLGVIALILLLLACFNYMNVAVATAATRLKEIAIRKVIGGKKKEIVHQFLTENFLLCGLAVASGALISYLFLLPAFNTLYPIKVPFQFSSPATAVFVFAGMFFFIGFSSGAYPAFYIASFSPINIMRGREKFGQRSMFSRVLLTLQFVLAFTAIVASFVFIDNSIYQMNKDWGYDHAQNVVVPLPDKKVFLALRDKAEKYQDIISIAGSANHIGYENSRSNFEHEGKRLETVHYRVGFNYLETMNIRLKEGRPFEHAVESDRSESVIVNVEFVNMMGWKNPIGQFFEYDSARRYVIGVAENFHYDGFYDPLGPVMFTIAPETEFRYLVVKSVDQRASEIIGFLRSAWHDIAPDDPFDGFLQDDVFHRFYRDNTSNIKVLSFISTMAVTLGCLGLFGLVSFNITRRLKEFSVRKIFGANLGQIFRLMSRDYMWILIIAFGVGAPLGFFLMNTLIQLIYPDPQPTGALPFIIAFTVMAITVGITVASQMNRVSRENPTKTLRTE